MPMCGLFSSASGTAAASSGTRFADRRPALAPVAVPTSEAALATYRARVDQMVDGLMDGDRLTQTVERYEAGALETVTFSGMTREQFRPFFNPR